MRLHLICEIFDELSMDGVTIKNVTAYGAEYRFKDPRLVGGGLDFEYIVQIYRDWIRPDGDFSDFVANEKGSNPHYPNSIASDSIFLKTVEKGWELTEVSNPVFVYTKLLACIKHFWSLFGRPVFLEFSGSRAAMNVTYSRLLNRVAKMDDAFRFVPYEDGTFVRGDVLDRIPTELGVHSKVADAEREYSDYVDSVRMDKKRKREFRRSSDSDGSYW